MINASELGQHLKARGFDFYSGVPCSFLKYLINYAVSECDYVMATNEGDAVATCAGAIMGGRKSIFLCQNSGLTNASSPLSSLIYTFEIPLLGFVSLRGEEGIVDAPQHALMGRITTDLLDSLSITWEFLTTENEELIQQLDRANTAVESGRPFFFVVRKGTLAPFQLAPSPTLARTIPRECRPSSNPEHPTRREALERLRETVSQSTALLATTGFTGRELCEVEDSPGHFYMVGSMGCISPIGLGLALAQPSRRFVAIDGDGALLMRMGALATNAYYHPPNLLHLVLDNGEYESTGGQTTVSPQVDFVGLAKAAGYPLSVSVHTLDEMQQALLDWQAHPQLTFVHLQIRPGSAAKLGRPGRTPVEIKERLMAFVAGDSLSGGSPC